MKFYASLFRLCLLLGWLMIGCALSSFAEMTEVRLTPSETDSRIRADASPHVIYLSGEIVVDHKPSLPADRHTLLVWLPGTHGVPGNNNEFNRLAANLGYHVVSLSYPDEIDAMISKFDPDPNILGDFRAAALAGGKTRYNSVSQADSIENRVVQLVRYLQSHRPDESWEQFLTPEKELRWEAVAFGGHSQGGGHAAFIGIKHRVERVICFGSPKDYNKALDQPATWFREKSATPKNRFFAFNHVQDPKGPTLDKFMGSLAVLGLAQYGKPADVSKESPPYHHARILTTSYPVFAAVSPDGRGPVAAHSAVIVDRFAPLLKDVWTYLLTENVSDE